MCWCACRWLLNAYRFLWNQSWKVNLFYTRPFQLICSWIFSTKSIGLVGRLTIVFMSTNKTILGNLRGSVFECDRLGMTYLLPQSKKEYICVHVHLIFVFFAMFFCQHFDDWLLVDSKCQRSDCFVISTLKSNFDETKAVFIVFCHKTKEWEKERERERGREESKT